MKIYTGTGDEGMTALFGGGRVKKTHPRIAAYGTVDEANAMIGIARSFATDHPESDRLDALLEALQEELFIVGADLATPSDSKARTPRINDTHVERIERSIDMLDEELPALKQFILPGGSLAASALHVARTVSRRAERLVIEAAESSDISSAAAIYLNRLSDYLFVLGRWTNHTAGVEERLWSPRRDPEK